MAVADVEERRVHALFGHRLSMNEWHLEDVSEQPECRVDVFDGHADVVNRDKHEEFRLASRCGMHRCRGRDAELAVGSPMRSRGQQRLARCRRAVQEDPFRDLGAKIADALGVAEVVDHLAQLLRCLVGAGDIRPGDRWRGVGLDPLGARSRHEPHQPEDRDHDQALEDDRQPVVQLQVGVRVAEERHWVHQVLIGKCRPLVNLLQSRVGRVAATNLRARPAVEEDHVGGEVVLTADQ